jgi:hypothetical protein
MHKYYIILSNHQQPTAAQFLPCILKSMSRVTETSATRVASLRFALRSSRLGHQSQRVSPRGHLVLSRQMSWLSSCSDAPPGAVVPSCCASVLQPQTVQLSRLVVQCLAPCVRAVSVLSVLSSAIPLQSLLVATELEGPKRPLLLHYPLTILN